MLIKSIVEFDYIFDLLNEVINSVYQNQLTQVPEVESVITGTFCPMEKNRVHFQSHLVNKDKVFLRTQYLPINNSILQSYMDKMTLFIDTPSSPGQVMLNDCISGMKKKIFICRDFRDVFNSWAKYIDPGIQAFQTMELLKDPELFMLTNYLNVNMFHTLMKTWSEHIETYLKHKDDFYFVRYEDLIENPVEIFSGVAEYIAGITDREYIKTIVNNKMNKELSDMEYRHKHFRHFSGSKKRTKEWRDNFSETMLKTTLVNAGHLLEAMGYDTSETLSTDNMGFKNKVEAAFALYNRAESGNKTAKIMAKGIVHSLDEILGGSRAAVYGTGKYSDMLCAELRNSDSILYFIDDNADKYGKHFHGKKILPSSEIISVSAPIDKLLIAVHPAHYEVIKNKVMLMGVPESMIINCYSGAFDSFYVNIERD